MNGIRGSTKGRRMAAGSLSRRRQGGDSMRDNSGKGESSNNNRNPTLRDHERARGHSGEAIVGEKKAGTGGDRIDAKDRQGC